MWGGIQYSTRYALNEGYNEYGCGSPHDHEHNENLCAIHSCRIF